MPRTDIPKNVIELRNAVDTRRPNKSPYILVQEFLRKNATKAYKVSQLQKALNMNSNIDYWSISHACKFLVQDGLLESFGTNPCWFAWKG
jgi:hypothetical protein